MRVDVWLEVEHGPGETGDRKVSLRSGKRQEADVFSSCISLQPLSRLRDHQLRSRRSRRLFEGLSSGCVEEPCFLGSRWRSQADQGRRAFCSEDPTAVNPNLDLTRFHEFTRAPESAVCHPSSGTCSKHAFELGAAFAGGFSHPK